MIDKYSFPDIGESVVQSDGDLSGGKRANGEFKHDSADKPLVSIVTIVFNGEEHIEDTINSVLSQDYDNIEYIVIDGGSTDGTLDILKKYEANIDLWISEGDRGIADAFNKGVRYSRGGLIGLINADDYYEPGAISALVSKYLETLSSNKPIIFYGKTYRLTEDGVRQDKKDSTRSICLRLPFSHCSTFLTRSYYMKNGGYSTDYKIAMDIDLFMRGVSGSDLQHIDQYLATQRDGGISSRQRIRGYVEYFKCSAKQCSLLERIFYFMVKYGLAKLNAIR